MEKIPEGITLIALSFITFFAIQIIYAILVIYLFSKRHSSIHVQVVESNDSNMPEIINRQKDEKVLTSARNLTTKNNFFLTNKRLIFFYQSLFNGKDFTRYFTLKSVTTIDIVYKNPYGWLILAGLNLFAGYSLANAESEFKDGLFIASLIISLLYVLLWYYVKGYYLEFYNGKRSSLFSQEKAGLISISKSFENFNNNDERFVYKSETKDIICSNCKSEITLEGEELKAEEISCPVCNSSIRII